jgi:hypothetical protein
MNSRSMGHSIMSNMGAMRSNFRRVFAFLLTIGYFKAVINDIASAGINHWVVPLFVFSYDRDCSTAVEKIIREYTPSRAMNQN